MNRVTCHMSTSLDGFVAGPDQSRDNPIGVGGMRLHDWHQHAGEPGREADVGPRDELMKPSGAYVMGRNMFGPIRGEWEGEWAMTRRTPDAALTRPGGKYALCQQHDMKHRLRPRRV